MAVCCKNLPLGALSSLARPLCWMATYLKSSVFFFLNTCVFIQPILVDTRSKTWICGRSFPGFVGSNPTAGLRVALLWLLFVAR
jgi:hypothetical protein